MASLVQPDSKAPIAGADAGRARHAQPSWTWDEMLTEFRALGGVADNVCLKDGPIGRGLFPLDPSQPVTVFAPANLLFAVDDLEFENGVLRVKHGAPGIGAHEREFFELYQQTFSWGTGGRTGVTAFIEAMEALPVPVREQLTSQFGMDAFFQGTLAERAQKQFLRSRKIRSQGRAVIMPVVELANHGPQGAGYDFKNGIAVKGTFPDEVLARYNVFDAFGVFASWGFASKEPTAFSLPIKITLGGQRLTIRRNITETRKLGKFSAPIVKQKDNTIELSYLLLGSVKFPRLAKGAFHAVAQEIGLPNAEEAFDRILHFNRMKLLGLLGALEEHEGAAIALLRKMCRYQLQAMSHCVSRSGV